jgi:hypothetical protein
VPDYKKKTEEGTFYNDERSDMYVKFWEVISESHYVNFKK